MDARLTAALERMATAAESTSAQITTMANTVAQLSTAFDNNRNDVNRILTVLETRADHLAAAPVINVAAPNVEVAAPDVNIDIPDRDPRPSFLSKKPLICIWRVSIQTRGLA